MEETAEKIMKRHTIANFTIGPDNGEISSINNFNLIIFGCLFLLFGILISMIASNIVLFLFFLALALVLFSTAKKQSSIHQAVLEETYRIYEDICLDKKMISCSDSNDYIFLLEQHGWLTLSVYDWHLFDAAKPGDKFYLLWIPDAEIIRLFSRKTWTLDPDEFMLTDGYYVPVTQHKR